jgi:putative tryptophan/tyrosine transport system substrate-binding protein
VGIDYRRSAGDAANTRKYATELVALGSDVILTNGAAGVAPLLQASRTVPIVFVTTADPIGLGRDNMSKLLNRSCDFLGHEE